MKSPLQNILAGFALLFTVFIYGCGPAEPTVIQHTEDYQLTEQEQANKEAEMEARKNGGN